TRSFRSPRLLNARCLDPLRSAATNRYASRTLQNLLLRAFVLLLVHQPFVTEFLKPAQSLVERQFGAGLNVAKIDAGLVQCIFDNPAGHARPRLDIAPRL